MVYCVCMIYLVYMQQLLLCRLQLNLRQLQYSYIWLIPNITPFILSNLFIGHWDMMDLVYIQHSSSCRVQFHLLCPEEISCYCVFWLVHYIRENFKWAGVCVVFILDCHSNGLCKFSCV